MKYLVSLNNVKINIFWFRRDLRLNDNVGLFYALKHSNVLPIFIFDPTIISELPKNDARLSFIYTQLAHLNDILLSKGCSLALFYAKPIDVFNKLIAENAIDTVYTNHDYEPYAINRDNEIETILKRHSIHFKTYKDQVIFEKNEVVKNDNTPYKVYTPYSKKWLDKLQLGTFKFFPSEELLQNIISHHYPFLTLEAIGFVFNKNIAENYNLTPQLIFEYQDKRDFPAKAATSKLGTHLRFGTVSVRKIVTEANKQQNKTFLKELIWREFFMQIIWHFPHTVTKSFKPKYDKIKWINNEGDFIKWCNGTTGYPLVDAGMRELNATGFMHNRVRMLVGSFLCKHLLIDWRLGEAYFAKKLNDYELSSNIGNWQWVAGCGVDAAPYFRIFNPITQIEKFDKQLEYIKKWVPEFNDLNYINSQIIDHKFARERCLKVYKEAVS